MTAKPGQTPTRMAQLVGENPTPAAVADVDPATFTGLAEEALACRKAGIAFEVTLTAVAIYAPAAQDVLGTRPLGWPQLLVLACFPVLVWGVDEVYRLAVEVGAFQGRQRLGAAEPAGPDRSPRRTAGVARWS